MLYSYKGFVAPLAIDFALLSRWAIHFACLLRWAIHFGLLPRWVVDPFWLDQLSSLTNVLDRINKSVIMSPHRNWFGFPSLLDTWYLLSISDRLCQLSIPKHDIRLHM